MAKPAPIPAGRIVFDLTSASRWAGPPVGIVRVQRELALHARRHRPDTVFAIFDPTIMAYRSVGLEHVDAILAGRLSLNTWGQPEPTGRRQRRSAWVPRRLYDLWQIRRTALRLLERVRLGSSRAWARRLADRVQRPLISVRYRASMIEGDGSRRDFPTPDKVLGDPVAFAAGDILLSAGTGWTHSSIAALARLKATAGLKRAVACFDIIPLQFPHYFKPRDVDDMRAYWSDAFACADLVVVNSQAVARDVAAYCAEHGIALGATAICPLGADPATLKASADAALPPPLQAGRYALFVSTIEPRKGHELLLKIWLRLLADGVPQAADFKLVFVGRRGWLMEAFEKTLRDTPGLADSLIVLPRAPDDLLDLLYRRAAFCLYPSFYEGYGLPVVEAFARGKAVIASDGGSLPEVVGAFSPCLPAGDEAAWYETLKLWIADPSARAPYEAAIAERFRHPSWDEAAAGFFGAVEGALSRS